MYSLKPDAKLMGFQKEGVKLLLPKRYAILGDEPGLGKTLQFLGQIIVLKKQGLVICKSSHVQNWIDDIEKHTHLTWELYDHKNKNKIYTANVILCTYHQSKFLKRKWDLVAVDEAHNFKNPVAKGTVSLTKTIKEMKPKYFTVITGTVLKNKVPEMFVPLYWMAQCDREFRKITDRYGSYYLFCNRFALVKQVKIKGMKNGKPIEFKKNEYYGEKNMDELRSYLEPVFIRRTKEEVLKDLPEKIEKEVIVDYPEDPLLGEIFEQFLDTGVSSDAGKKALNAAIKAPYTAEYVKELMGQTDSPILAFSCYKEPLRIIAKEIEGAVVLTGDTPKDERKRIKEAFDRGEIKVLLATIELIKEGFTLTKSSHMVLNDIPWVPSDLEQVMDRIRRIGQKSVCVYHFILGSVVDKKILRVIKAKIKTISRAIRPF